MPPKPKSICSIAFANKEMELTNIASILWYPDILKSLPISTVKFYVTTVTYELPPPLSTKFFNFNKFEQSRFRFIFGKLR